MREFQVEQLKQLPLDPDETWQGGIVPMPAPGFEDDEEVRRPGWPKVPIWFAVESEQFYPGEPQPGDLISYRHALDLLVEFACDKDAGGYRPGIVEVADAALADFLRPLLEQAGITLVVVDELPVVDQLLDSIGSVMEDALDAAASIPGALTGDNVTIDTVRTFAATCKDYCDAKVWRVLSSDDLIQIESPDTPAGMGFCTVLGGHQIDDIHAINFFDSAEQFYALSRDEWSEENSEYLTKPKFSVSFDLRGEMSLEDQVLWDQHQLPVAGDEAYPSAVWWGSGGDVRRPSAEELSLVQAIMQTLMDSATRDFDTGRWSRKVPTPTGEKAVNLALPEMLDPPDAHTLRQRGFEPDTRAVDRVHGAFQKFLALHQDEGFEKASARFRKSFGKVPLEELVGPLQTPLEQAQDLCYTAFESVGYRRRMLAQQALKLCPDCADAYVLLAECTNDPDERCDLYAQGVEAGRRALGAERFKEHAGHFWEITDTRPYMRALQGLAETFHEGENFEQAAIYYREMLELNPSDTLQARGPLFDCLLNGKMDTQAAELIKGDAPDTPLFHYGRALLAFRRQGDTPKARKLLAKAIEFEPAVQELLLDDELTIEDVSGYDDPEYEGEITQCVSALIRAFSITQDAMAWLEEN